MRVGGSMRIFPILLAALLAIFAVTSPAVALAEDAVEETVQGEMP